MSLCKAVMYNMLYAYHCHNRYEKKHGAKLAVVYEMLYAKHCHKRCGSKSGPNFCSQLISVVCMKQTNTCLQS